MTDKPTGPQALTEPVPQAVVINAVSVFSTKGPRSESENHVLVQEEKGIFVIADGFGGPQPGARAARTACEAISGYLFREAGDQDATLPFELRSYFSLAGNVLFNGLIHANQKILALNKGKNVHEKGGASVLAGYLDDGLLALASVGNCAAWLLRDAGAVPLNMPRSYGRLADPLSADVRLDRRVPLMALGVAPDLEPEICEYRVERGDWILLHTEGMPARLREGVSRLRGEFCDPFLRQVDAVYGGGGGIPESLQKVAVQRVQELLDRERFDSDLSVSLIIL